MEILVIFSVIWIVICCCVASRKHRSVIGWFFLGLFFGLFATIAILCLPTLEERKLTAKDVDKMFRNRYPSIDKIMLDEYHEQALREKRVRGI